VDRQDKTEDVILSFLCYIIIGDYMNNIIELFNNNIWLVYYLIIINIFTLIAFGIDKALAIGHLSRISEATLITLSFVGGSIGGLLGMCIFHHKTLKLKFKIGLPLILIIQLVILYLIVR
jgi:uncharacterized membrane protein YsdA (DUF1294 family)